MICSFTSPTFTVCAFKNGSRGVTGGLPLAIGDSRTVQGIIEGKSTCERLRINRFVGLKIHWTPR